MIISKHVIPMRVCQKKSKSCKPIALNSFIDWHHVNFRFRLVSDSSLKLFYLTRGFDIFRSCHGLYLGMVDSFLSVSDIWTWEFTVYFLAFFIVSFNGICVVSSSKIFLLKSVKIFHWIFGIILIESHALSRVHNFAPVCESTIF